MAIENGVLEKRLLTVAEAMKELAEVRAIPVRVKNTHICVHTNITRNAANLFQAIDVRFPSRMRKRIKNA